MKNSIVNWKCSKLGVFNNILGPHRQSGSVQSSVVGLKRKASAPDSLLTT